MQEKDKTPPGREECHSRSQETDTPSGNVTLQCKKILGRTLKRAAQMPSNVRERKKALLKRGLSSSTLFFKKASQIPAHDCKIIRKRTTKTHPDEMQMTTVLSSS
jgi:hypothetical protein